MCPEREREFFIDNIHLIIVMIRWPGLAPWEFVFPFPGSLTSTFPGVPGYPGVTRPIPIETLLPNNQRQHRALHIQKDVLPYALC